MHVLFIPSFYTTEENPVNGIFVRDRALTAKRIGCQIGIIAPYFYSLKSFRAFFKKMKSTECHVDNEIPTYRSFNRAWFPKVPSANIELWIKAGHKLFNKYVSDRGYPDIIHAHGVSVAGMCAMRLKKIFQIPFIISEDGTRFDKQNDHIGKFEKYYIRKAYREAEKILVVNHEMVEIVSREFSISRSKIEYVPNIVDDMFYDSEFDARNGENNIVFVSVGNLKYNKGHRDLMYAFDEVYKKRKNVQLKIIGSGPELDDLLDIKKKLDAAKQIMLIGQVSRERVRKELIGSDVFVLPSHYETFGIVLCEALACGKPVIATKCSGPRSILNDQIGVMVEIGNYEQMAGAMLYMADNLDKFDKNKLRSYSEELCSQKKIGQIFKNIYNYAIKRDQKNENIRN